MVLFFAINSGQATLDLRSKTPFVDVRNGRDAPLGQGVSVQGLRRSMQGENRLVTPRFSIFIPVWNGARWIGGAIESVLAQTHPDWELVVGDNASTDDVEAVVGRYADSRIRLHRWTTHTDLCENFNRTMLLCRYEWVQPLGADDRLDAHCLESMAARVEAIADRTTRLSAIIAAVRRVDSRGQPANASYYGYRGRARIPDGLHDAASWLHCALTGVHPWNIGTAAFSREVLAEMGGFLRAEIGLCAEIDLVLRAAAYGDILYIDEPRMDFTVRCDGDSQTRGFSERAWNRALAPVALALVSGFSVHEDRRKVSRRERAAVHAVVAQLQIQRAFQHRYRPGGRGRRGALLDVARAIRWSPATVLRPRNLAYALAAILAPRAMIGPARTTVLKHSYRNDVTLDGDTNEGAPVRHAGASAVVPPEMQKPRDSGRLESMVTSVLSWFSIN
jgi:glycosyltransferase involved in cell wall biosynthesis